MKGLETAHTCCLQTQCSWLKALTRYEGFGNAKLVQLIHLHGAELKALTRYEGFGKPPAVLSMCEKRYVEGTDPL